MGMSRDEAVRTALAPVFSGSTVSLDLAARIMEENGEPALRQLCELKACIQRTKGWLQRTVPTRDDILNARQCLENAHNHGAFIKP